MKETWTTYFLYTGSITAWSNWHRARATGGCSNTQCSGNRFVSCLAWFQSPTFSNASHRPNFWFAAYCITRKQHIIKYHQFVNICSEVEIKIFWKRQQWLFLFSEFPHPSKIQEPSHLGIIHLNYYSIYLDRQLSLDITPNWWKGYITKNMEWLTVTTTVKKASTHAMCMNPTYDYRTCSS